MTQVLLSPMGPVSPPALAPYDRHGVPEVGPPGMRPDSGAHSRGLNPTPKTVRKKTAVWNKPMRAASPERRATYLS